MRRSIIAAAAFLLFGCLHMSWGTPASAALRPADSKPLPDVRVLSLQGDTLELRDICKGKISFIYFWATWCKVCSKDMKKVFALMKEFGEDVAVFGISWKDSPEAIQKYFKKREQNLPGYIDADGKVFAAFGFRQTPSVVMVNRRGEVVYKGYGSFRKFKRVLRAELKKK